ncbi:MAG: hypothetical protein AAGF74_12570 [Pseudomonadota bacterium]
MAPKSPLAQSLVWQKAWFASGQMWMAACEVIWRRNMQMLFGTMSEKEALRMVMEKPVTFAVAGQKATQALMKGRGQAAATLAATKPLRAKAKSNARRLRSPKS